MIGLRSAAVLAGLLLTAVPALADGKIYVQLPDLSSYQGQQAEDFLYQLVLANVVASNCSGYEITDEEWSLLTDSADIIAYEQLGLDVGAYDRDYSSAAFDALDDSTTCDTVGPKVEPIIDELVALGGSRDALPDQDAAYEAFQARQAIWEAVASGTPAPAKTKTK